MRKPVVIAFLIMTIAALVWVRTSAQASGQGLAAWPAQASQTFADVPPTHPYYAEIEWVHRNGYTAGCATDPLSYCPDATMNRAESAVFVERGIHSASYDPPPPSSQIFADLPLDSWAAKWVNGLWEDQYTAGCGTNPLMYCPWQGHTRAEGAVFYLRMMRGSSYAPAAPTEQRFADVPLGSWYAGWAEAAYEAGLIPACETTPALEFCPEHPLTRGLAAYMMYQAKQGAATPRMLTGWWTEMYDADFAAQLARYAAEGNTLVLGNGGGWVTSPSERVKIQRFLDEAQKLKIQVIVSMTRSRHTPYGIPANEFTDTIKAFKDHPALYAWYLADEPELYNNNDGDRSDDWQIPHGYLATDPGYYQLAKAADPNHPVLISFNTIYTPLDTYWAKIANFLDVTDLVGMHNYPFWSVGDNAKEFGSYDSRTQYDKWKYALEESIGNGKTGFIATAQGFGYNSHDSVYRDPTLKELRYQVFTAVVQGVDKVLYWFDGWTNDNVSDLVRQVIGLEQQIGEEMNRGVTNDPRLTVNQPTSNLVYRYGVNGTRHAILAVNIANRTYSSGATLSDVRFTLPAGVLPAQVEVLGENRTLSVTDGTFTDSFSAFQVHIYAFDTGAGGLSLSSSRGKLAPSQGSIAGHEGE